MRKFVRKQYWLFLFFIGLSILTVFSYRDSEVQVSKVLTPKEIMKEAIQVVLSDTKNNRRKIASADLDLNSESILKIDAFCSEKLPKIYLRKSLAILQINACLKEFPKTQNFKVINVTNGYKGQVFKTGEKKFKTDFIQLNNGANEIQILFYTKDRQTITQTLEITSGS